MRVSTPATIAEFWSLLAESRMLSANEIQRASEEFTRVHGDIDPAAVRTLAGWLVSQRILTRDQAMQALSGQPAPLPPAPASNPPAAPSDPVARIIVGEPQMRKPFARPKSVSNRMSTILLVLIPLVACLLAVVVTIWSGIFSSPPVANNHQAKSTVESERPTTPVRDPPTRKSASDIRGGIVTKPDDGNTLWASPTAGEPVALEYIPPDAQILFIVRPADMLAQPEGEKVLRSLGPAFAAGRQEWEKAAGVALSEVQQLVVALHDNQGEMPIASYRVTLAKPIDDAELVKRWQNPQAKEAGGKRHYERGPVAYLIPGAAGGRVFVMGTPAHVKEAAAAGMTPLVLSTQLAQLRRVSDADRHVTVLLSPSYLFGDGQKLLEGSLEKLKEPLEWFIGDEIRALMCSLHFGDDLYVEVGMVATLERRAALGRELTARLDLLPKRVEDYFGTLDVPPYWRKVAARYPLMINYLRENTRVGVEDDVAIVNAVAPGALAHNLVFGAEMALASTAGAVVSDTGAVVADAVPKSLAELLAWKTSFEVPQNDLNLVMADLEQEVKGSFPGLGFAFSIKIIGKDLEADGITRNQKIVDFKEQEKPLADILTGLVRKANPDPSAKSAADPAQKLVWLIAPDPDKLDQQVILITTRKAAETKNYQLPAAFLPTVP
jgi:hypothetical protein